MRMLVQKYIWQVVTAQIGRWDETGGTETGEETIAVMQECSKEAPNSGYHRRETEREGRSCTGEEANALSRQGKT